MLKRRDLIILVIAAVCGLAAFMIISNILKQSSKIRQRYVIAAQVLIPGQILTDRDLALSDPIEGADAANLYLQTQDVVGQEALEEIPQGQTVKRSQLKKISTGAVIASATPTPTPLPVPPGRRSFALSAGDIEQVPGDLAQGTFVDIMGVAEGAEGLSEIRTLTRGAQVLSVEKSEGSIETVKVALTSTGTEMVSNSLQKGKLRFAVAPEGAAQPQGVVELIRGVDKEASPRTNPQQPANTNNR